jgi:predicted solute-binding protein
MGLTRVWEIAAEADKQLGLPAEELARYLSESIDYSLDEENRRGLQQYFERAAALGLIPRVRPMEWAGVAATSAVSARPLGR